MARKRLDEGIAFSGFILGVVAGSVWGLIRGPRIRLKPEDISQPGELMRSVLPKDSLQQSIAEGKTVARRVRQVGEG